MSLEKVASTCGFDVVDVVPARRQNLDLKQVVLTVSVANAGSGPHRNSTVTVTQSSGILCHCH